ncbi:histone acetyltransferase [Baffinella frigidus]|nr:histone acetyltransferase [Cryptophyta sp. CCMP2293]|mmetsp:Transcript_59524/g.136029  ORF Transcript_59524/g.136029 Transcript_59524/m.136029 type:complete len:181 (+) Transcript_59524:1-543(+)
MAAATCVVRVGRREDACHLLELIRELAVVENELDQVKMTEETLVRDGWPLPEEVAAGAVPRFDVLFAEVDGAVVGFALYFHNYSTWEGLGIYLEDLYVKKDFRGRGIGTQLIRGVAKVAEQRGCARLQWQVIDFNKPAIKYYESLGARERVEAPVAGFDGKWLNFIADRDVIHSLAAAAL